MIEKLDHAMFDRNSWKINEIINWINNHEEKSDINKPLNLCVNPIIEEDKHLEWIGKKVVGVAGDFGSEGVYLEYSKDPSGGSLNYRVELGDGTDFFCESIQLVEPSWSPEDLIGKLVWYWNLSSCKHIGILESVDGENWFMMENSPHSWSNIKPVKPDEVEFYNALKIKEGK